MIVATAGHIDHGKTSLVKALTGVDTDRLPEERRRGISIDLGFAYWPLPDGRLIGIVDVPGHERFIHNMLAGVCGVDFALIVIAADDGVMPQTVEHVQIIRLLGIRRGIVAITKSDRVSAQRISQVEEEARTLLVNVGLDELPFSRVSALSGEGIDLLRTMLLAASDQHKARCREGQHFRLAVDRVFTVAGAGTVVTGAVFNGAIEPGAKLVLSPNGRKARVRGIQIRGQAVGRAQAGDRCALNLAMVDVGEIRRGDWVVDEAIHLPSCRMEARIQLLASLPPLAHWTPVHVHIGTADVIAHVAIRGGKSIGPGESARVHLVSAVPMAAISGDRFILRDCSGQQTLGGGAVIDPKSERRTTVAANAWLDALESGQPEVALSLLLASQNVIVTCDRFERVFNLSRPQAEEFYAAADAVVIGHLARVAMSRPAWEGLRQRILARVSEFHTVEPHLEGIESAMLRKELASWLRADAFSSVVRDLVSQGRLQLDGTAVKVTGHIRRRDEGEETAWQAIQALLLTGGFAVLTVSELAKQLGIEITRVVQLLGRRGNEAGMMRIDADLYYPKTTLAVLAANAALVARSASKGLFKASDYRDAVGLGRTRVIKILEFFDKLEITQRVGDARKMHKNFTPILGAAKPALAAPIGKNKRPSVEKWRKS